MLSDMIQTIFFDHEPHVGFSAGENQHSSSEANEAMLICTSCGDGPDGPSLDRCCPSSGQH